MNLVRPYADWTLNRHARLGGVTEVRILGRDRDGQHRVWSSTFRPEHLETLLEQLDPAPDSLCRRPAFGSSGRSPGIPFEASDGPCRPRPENHPRDGQATITVSLQPVSPALAGTDSGRHGAGQIRRVSRTTRDGDILAYSLFAVDIDPVRPSGVSATDDEKAEARSVMEAVRGWLLERKIRALEADSGNGYHLLVPLVPSTGVALLKAFASAWG